jgi:hypothetical protein
MRVLQLNSKCRNLMSFAIHAVRVTFADGTLCAVCGGLYGMVFGGFGAMVRHELSVSRMFSVTIYCAIIGFAIGAAVGAVREISRALKLRQRSFERATRTAANFSERQRSRMPQVSTRGVAQNSLICIAEKTQSRITAISG